MSEPAAAPTGLGPKGIVTTIEPDRYERTVVRRSAQTRATVPSVEFAAEVDMERSLATQAELGCGITALLVRAAAHALRLVPRVNGAYRDGHYELYSRINIGVTIAEEGFYAVPTVFDADEKTASEIGAEIAEHRARALDGELTAGRSDRSHLHADRLRSIRRRHRHAADHPPAGRRAGGRSGSRGPGGSRRCGRGGPHDGGDARGRSPDRLRCLRVVVPGGVQGASGGGNRMTGADPANEQVAQRLADARTRRARGATPRCLRASGRGPRGRAVDRRRSARDDRAGRRRPRRRTAVAPHARRLASGELGISLTDALAHPAVARAQELVGAPSYEEQPRGARQATGGQVSRRSDR